MMIYFLICNILVTILGWFVLSWAHAYLFTYLGEDEDGDPVFMYHALTIPAKMIASLMGCLSIAAPLYTWGLFLQTLVSKIGS